MLHRSCPFVFIFGLLLTLGSCSGSGSSGSRQDFSLVSVSVVPNEQNVELNRAIEFRFNQPLDPRTISQNTIGIAVANGETIPDPDQPGATLSISGIPAVGEFIQRDDRTVAFQPACPTGSDLTSGGFLPGVRYTITLPGQSTGGLALAASNGGPGLDQGLSLSFRTTVSTDLTEAFVDISNNPPAAVIRTAGDQELTATRLELAGDPTNRIYLERSSPAEPGRPAGGFFAPLNLYSSSLSQVDVIVELDQPIDPSASNVAPDNIGLEFRSTLAGVTPETWERFATTVTLERNCTSAGSTVRLSPLGPLPQGRLFRVFISSNFRDLVGQTNVGPLNDFAVFETDIAADPITGMSEDLIDEILEDFTTGGVGSLEDIDSASDLPRAPWGTNGAVTAAFDFPGTGGPNGNFDVAFPPNTDVVFDTTSQVFTGGPGFLQNETQVAVDGILECRDFFLPVSSTLQLIGPNPGRIFATGDVRIEGRISVDGNPADSLNTLGLTIEPALGAAGNGGGGAGGTGSPQLLQVSPRGGSGLGAFQAEGEGGQGGESGFTSNNSNNGENRRPGGGGGGRFGGDVQRELTVDGDTVLCRDQTLIGLDAEPGMTGSPIATGAITMTFTPMGGNVGPSPFTDASSVNDFWGDLIANPSGANSTLVRGELQSVWAGAGGGAGGDAVRTSIYPPTTFLLTNQNRGAGGGGGAGGLVILALGDISFGPQGQITATGGTGGGGENTSFFNRVGGGSGGGSGGHIVLQSASTIDFSEVDPINAAVSALGGQGGAGAMNLGGYALGAPNDPMNDSVPPFPDELALGCPPAEFFAQSAGGDGGPGVIQLHAPNTASILPPVSVDDFRTMILPPPVGLDLDEDRGPSWDGLLQPIFGSRSRAQSVWIPLGGIHVNPAKSAAEMVEFLFEGTDPASGRILTTNGEVPRLPAVLNSTLFPATALPYVETDGRTIVFDLNLLTGTNDIYRRNPNLMRLFEVQIMQGQATETFEVVSADADETTGELRLTVGGSNQPLAAFAAGGTVQVFPRFFRVETGGVSSQLPESASITIRFQATTADANGDPDLLGATKLTANLADLNAADGNEDFRFFRFVIDFDLTADGSALRANSPRPSLDFLRVPFKF